MREERREGTGREGEVKVSRMTSVTVMKAIRRHNAQRVGACVCVCAQASDSTALHIAAAGGHADVVHHLIDIGAAADVENAVRNSLSITHSLSCIATCVRCTKYAYRMHVRLKNVKKFGRFSSTTRTRSSLSITATMTTTTTTTPV